jgi:hypothetical protein
VADGLFRALVWRWAEASGGLLPAHPADPADSEPAGPAAPAASSCEAGGPSPAFERAPSSGDGVPACGPSGDSDGPDQEACPAGYVRAANAAGGEGRVRWAGLKGAGRAVEKAIRCYGDDVSRLCDVVRQVRMHVGGG